MSIPPTGASAGAKAATGVLPGLLEPPLDDRFERRGVDVVELVPALAAGLDQTRGLQNVEMLRDRLPRRAKPVLDRQARADLKERLPVPVGQLVEDRAARGIGQCLEDVTHTPERYASRCLPVNPDHARTADTPVHDGRMPGGRVCPASTRKPRQKRARARRDITRIGDRTATMVPSGRKTVGGARKIIYSPLSTIRRRSGKGRGRLRKSLEHPYRPPRPVQYPAQCTQIYSSTGGSESDRITAVTFQLVGGDMSGDAATDSHRSFSRLAVRLLADLRAADWSARDEGPWCRVLPDGHVPRRQGWKLHVSATVLSATQVLERALPVLVAHRCAAKFAGDHAWATWLTSPRCSRGTAGKFLTAYPDDAAHFRRVAEGLHRASGGLAGAEILSDRRYRPGSVVYYRFGGFTGARALDDDGRYRPVVVDPAGQAVEDSRKAWFSPPSWAVPVLPYPPPAPPVRGPVMLGGRFSIRKAIRHSSRGGVFLGTDELTGAGIVVKQARAYMDVDPSGRDCRDRLRNEANLVSVLAPAGLAPRFIALVTEGDDLYLVREAVVGTTLRRWVLGHHRNGGVPLETGLAMARSVALLFAAAHRAELALVDVSPDNIMVDAGGRLWLTDLDHCVRQGEVIYPVGTPGYTAPELLAAKGPVTASTEADLFGLGGLLFLIAVGASPALVMDDLPGRPVHERLRTWLDTADATMPLAHRLTDAVIALTQHRPDARWRPSQVVRFLDRADRSEEHTSELQSLRHLVCRLL